MDQASFWIMVIGVSAVSILPRILPVALFSRLELPAPIKKWLSFVAPSVLGALTAISFLAPQGRIDLSPHNLYIWAFLPTVAVAAKTKNLFYTMLTGISALAILNHLFRA
ncbi:MAG TPA: AzlD domain-containing protein [Firmicutes bacterium]|nr:AzlD domain-containing protein [Bacillota bacterium]